MKSHDDPFSESGDDFRGKVQNFKWLRQLLITLSSITIRTELLFSTVKSRQLSGIKRTLIGTGAERIGRE
jgi:hypothetical protein